jgi:hypothetical protein
MHINFKMVGTDSLPVVMEERRNRLLRPTIENSYLRNFNPSSRAGNGVDYFGGPILTPMARQRPLRSRVRQTLPWLVHNRLWKAG